MRIEIRDLSLYYEVVGQGRPVLLIHGWPYDHSQIAHEMEPVFRQRQGWRRIYVDLPGMGKTQGTGWIQSSDDFLVVLRRVIDVLLPGERLLLVGSSFGAYLARGLVHGLTSMIDGVLLSVPSAAYPPQHRETEPRTIILRDATLTARLPTSSILDREYDATVVWENEHLIAYAEMLSAIPEADTTFLDKIRRDRSFSFDPDRPPSPLAAPSLFILGRQDAQVGYRQQLAFIENYSRATVGVVDGAGHWVWGERPDLCKALADDWLDRVEEWTRAGRPQ